MSLSNTVIAVKNVSKCYSIGHLAGGDDCMKYNPPGLRHAVEDALRNPLAWWKKISIKKEKFWALKDASFEVKAGDVIAVIGRNGAGKSTVLKILSRITEPTTGRIEISGRIASLLEVGTGFHAELTGRENIFLNGAILGMTRAEIKRKFDEIVAFSEIEKFLDTPVKRYSSGMYVRLAFSVAAHLEPEILIVDEVLAVGDSAFQKKCLGKMQEVSRTHGRTVIFVSHNMSAVLQLTTRAVVLDKGRVIYDGPTKRAVEHYAGAVGDGSPVFFSVEKLPRKLRGTGAMRFVSFRFERPVPIFSPDEEFQFIAKVRAQETAPHLRFSMTIFTPEGAPVGTCFGPERQGLLGGQEMEFEISIPRPRLAPGRYCCGVSVGKGDHRVGMVDFDTILDTLAFEVRAEEGDGGTVAEWSRGWGPIVLPDLKYRPAFQAGSFGTTLNNSPILSV